MRVLLLALCLLLGITSSTAKDKKEKVNRVTVTFNDGKVVTGFLYTDMDLPADEIRVGKEERGDYTTYPLDNVKQVETHNASRTEVYTYVPVIGESKLPSAFKRHHKPFKKPRLMMPLYKGTKITGYVMPALDYLMGKNRATVIYTFWYYYLIKGEKVARVFWMKQKGLSIGLKAYVKKIAFDDFPEIKQLIDDDKFDVKEFKDNPSIAWPVIDHILIQRDNSKLQ